MIILVFLVVFLLAFAVCFVIGALMAVSHQATNYVERQQQLDRLRQRANQQSYNLAAMLEEKRKREE